MTLSNFRINNPIYSETSIRMNANQSETKFSIQINPNQSGLWLVQSESFRPWIISDWFWLKIRIEPIRARIDSDWKVGFGSVRIYSDCCLGLNRIDFWPFFIKRDTKSFTDSYGMIALARMQISEWIGIVLIDSEWISIQYFRQGWAQWLIRLRNTIVTNLFNRIKSMLCVWITNWIRLDESV